MAPLSLTFFGTFRAALDQNRPIHFSTRSARALLVYLSMHPGQPFEREHLAALFWPEASKEQAQTSLRQTIYRLRQSLAQAGATDDHLIAETATVRFNAESDYRLDVQEFSQLLAQCSAHPHPRLEECSPCMARLLGAVELYATGFLTGFSLPDAPAFQEWQLFTQERLHSQVIAALDSLALYHQRRREYGVAAGFLQRILSLEPWREESHVALIRCYLLDGKRHLALAQYETLVHTLAAELDTTPGPEAQALYAQLRAVPALPKPIQPPVNPYRGLKAFGEEQAAYFFGREEMAAYLVEEIDRRPIILLVGVSGSGKSSLLYAGVLPALADATHKNRRVVALRPGEDPFAELVGALRPLLPSDTAANILAERLRTGEVKLPHLLAESLFGDSDQEISLVILIDQFEELLGRPAQDEVRQHFLDLLVESATAAPTPNRISFLISLRVDFLGQALTHGRFTSLIQDNVMVLGAMSPEEMARAVEMPGQMQGVFFESGLVERLIQEVGDDPGRLPLLQFCLTLLWQKQRDGWIGHAAYAEIEELSGALNHYADGVLARMDPEQQNLARRVLLI